MLPVNFVILVAKSSQLADALLTELTAATATTPVPHQALALTALSAGICDGSRCHGSCSHCRDSAWKTGHIYQVAGRACEQRLTWRLGKARTSDMLTSVCLLRPRTSHAYMQQKRQWIITITPNCLQSACAFPAGVRPCYPLLLVRATRQLHLSPFLEHSLQDCFTQQQQQAIISNPAATPTS